MGGHRKSTVAQLLAERLPRSVHLRGDLFRRMAVNGRADMTPDPSELSGPPASGLTEQRRPRAPASRRAAQGGKTPGTGPRTPSGARQSNTALRQLRLRHRLTASHQTTEDTVDEILDRAWAEARV